MTTDKLTDQEQTVLTFVAVRVRVSDPPTSSQVAEALDIVAETLLVSSLVRRGLLERRYAGGLDTGHAAPRLAVTPAGYKALE
jgi:hypothetical protein